jgi:hypothetical protein
MRAAACALVAALLVLCNVSEARAEKKADRLSSRLYTGVALSVGGDESAASLRVDDGPSQDEGSSPNVAFNAAYLQGLLPHFGVGLFAGVGSADTYWSNERGESRTRVRLALGPVFVADLPGTNGIEWRIGIPIGYTLAWYKPAKGRAVEETYSNASGMNAALVVGADIVGKHHGGFIDLAYSFHLTWLTHTATLRSDESVHVQQSYRYFERTLALGGGYVYQF